MNSFYLSCPIGLEESVLQELRLKTFSSLEIDKVDKGGVEVLCPMETGLALNLHLKTPTKILMRVKERKCRDFPKLFKIVSQIPWRDFLIQEKVEWRISSQQSRIINTRKAAETCEKALDKHFRAAPLSKKTKELSQNFPAQKVFLRFFEDRLIISLDTSGELLHIRGGRSDRGKASLRANYASCLLMFLLKDGSPAAGPLVDPMCGTGAFLLEALDFFSPSARESFPFNHWPCAAKLSFPSPSTPLNSSLVSKAFGFDLEPKLQKRDLERSDLTALKQDLFKPLPAPIKEELRASLLVCNPPYGKRIKIKGDRKAYFDSLLKRIDQEFQPSKFGIIIPADVPMSFEKLFDRILPFNNNGIKVKFCVREKD